MLFSFYQRLVYYHRIASFGLSLACYDIMLFIILLQRFICKVTIHTSKVNLISRIYQIMTVSKLNN